MKHRIRMFGWPVVIFLAAWGLAGAFPQDSAGFLGEWKGTAEVGVKLELTFHFYRVMDGTLSGAMDIPTAGAFGLAAADLKVQGKTISFSLPMGAVLKGTLDESGKSMAMTWSLNGRDTDFVLTKTASGEGYAPPVAAAEEPIDLSKFRGPFLGQQPPGMTPEPFGFRGGGGGPVFSPDGTEVIFRAPMSRSGLMTSRLDNGRWTEPRALGFSGGDLNISPDGRKLFFSSSNPLQSDVPALVHMDLWVVERTETGWSAPANLGPSINSEGQESWASMAANGNLYFFRDGGRGRAHTGPAGNVVRGGGAGSPVPVDIFCSKFRDGRYAMAEKLGPEVNSDAVDLDPSIASDENSLVFHSNRPGGFGQMDLYISFRNRDGSWTPAANLGDKINSAGSESSARFSADGKYLFFSRNGGRYWVSTKILDELREAAVKR